MFAKLKKYMQRWKIFCYFLEEPKNNRKITRLGMAFFEIARKITRR
jgi:hypothetical protein